MKDPDITAPYMFLMGKVIPEKWGRLRWGFMPYSLQHYYFFFRKFMNRDFQARFTGNLFHSWTSSAPPYFLSFGSSLLHVQKETS